jgi:hypothetical protein
LRGTVRLSPNVLFTMTTTVRAMVAHTPRNAFVSEGTLEVFSESIAVVRVAGRVV